MMKRMIMMMQSTALFLFSLTAIGADNHMDTSSMTMLSEEDYNARMLDIFDGCGHFQSLPASQEYTHINLQMHSLMAINFTGTHAEFDFAAGMIPHHTAAVDMCNTYNKYHDAEYNEGIASLCYNITFGPKDMGVWQYDFSQPGEVEQLMDVLRGEGLVDRYEQGCQSLTFMQQQALAVNMADYSSTSGSNIMNMGDEDSSISTNNMLDEPNPSHQHDNTAAASSHDHHDTMFMGCGNLEHAMTRDYLKINHDMHMYMALKWSGSADIDFLLGMIPHHEGAIAMCEIYYQYWQCAPGRVVCVDPIPLEDLTRMIGEGQAVSTLNLMHHMCEGHILATQPREVAWMKAELERISPVHLQLYEQMKADGTYPCDGMMGDHGDDDDDSMGMGTSAAIRSRLSGMLASTAIVLAVIL